MNNNELNYERMAREKTIAKTFAFLNEIKKATENNTRVNTSLIAKNHEVSTAYFTAAQNLGYFQKLGKSRYRCNLSKTESITLEMAHKAIDRSRVLWHNNIIPAVPVSKEESEQAPNLPDLTNDLILREFRERDLIHLLKIEELTTELKYKGCTGMVEQKVLIDF